MIENRCAFTGHRPKKFSWGYNEADARCVALKKALAAEIAKLVDTGYTRFYSGMAEGADTWAALTVLALKKKSRAETPLCPALRGTGGRVVSFSAGTLFFHFGAGGRGGLCEPGVQQELYAGT